MRARLFVCVFVGLLVVSRPDSGVERLRAQEPQQPTFRTEASLRGREGQEGLKPGNAYWSALEWFPK